MLIQQSHYVPSTAKHTTYCDSSGQIADEVMVVGGFASSDEKWQEFRARWAALMLEYKIEKPFHTVDYVAG